MSVLLPAPGGPVMPMRRARPMRRMQRAEQRVESGAMVLDDADRAGERRLPAGIEVARATWRSARIRLAQRRRLGVRASARLVVLVANVAHELLEQILERDEADGCAALVPHEARCSRARSISEQQLVARRGVLRDRRRDAARRAPPLRLEHVEHVHHADHVVERALVDRHAAVARSARICAARVRRALAARSSANMSARGVITSRTSLLAELHDAADDRDLLALADALELALAQQVLDRVALGGVDRSCRRVERRGWRSVPTATNGLVTIAPPRRSGGQQRPRRRRNRRAIARGSNWPNDQDDRARRARASARRRRAAHSRRADQRAGDARA